jgi:hypothetical protein
MEALSPLRKPSFVMRVAATLELDRQRDLGEEFVHNKSVADRRASTLGVREGLHAGERYDLSTRRMRLALGHLDMRVWREESRCFSPPQSIVSATH